MTTRITPHHARPGASFERLVCRILPLAAIALIGPARADQTCEALAEKIKTQLAAQGVTSYALGIVPAESVHERTVVGSCDNGTHRIVYRRPDNSSPPIPPGLLDNGKP